MVVGGLMTREVAHCWLSEVLMTCEFTYCWLLFVTIVHYGRLICLTKYYNIALSAGFTYRLDRLKPRASKFRGPPAKVYDICNTVILDFHTYASMNNVLYFLNNPSVTFLTQLHSISEYCRILNTPHHLRLY